MFTGIIRAQANIMRCTPRGQGVETEIGPVPATWSPEIGGSIAVDGICLTVEAIHGQTLVFYVSQETLACTTAARWEAGRDVHLEPAVTAATALDGHMVQGHVDAVGEVASRDVIGEDVVVGFRYPEHAAPMIFGKGSVAVDGVSLTINHVADGVFFVNLIPHTQQQTHLAERAIGTPVNIETDAIARQVVRVLDAYKQQI